MLLPSTALSARSNKKGPLFVFPGKCNHCRHCQQLCVFSPSVPQCDSCAKAKTRCHYYLQNQNGVIGSSQLAFATFNGVGFLFPLDLTCGERTCC